MLAHGIQSSGAATVDAGIVAVLGADHAPTTGGGADQGRSGAVVDASGHAGGIVEDGLESAVLKER